MNHSTSNNFLARVFGIVQNQFLADPLYDKIDHEDTVAAATYKVTVIEDQSIQLNSHQIASNLWLPPSQESYAINAEPAEIVKHVVEDVSPDPEPEVPVLPVTVTPTLTSVAAPVYRTAPEGFDLGPSELEESDASLNAIKVPMVKKTVVSPAMLDWLAEINRLEFSKVSDEIMSKSGRVMMKNLQWDLWYNYGEDVQGVRKEVADELESLGYVVSYNRHNRVMAIQLESATLTWLIRY